MTDILSKISSYNLFNYLLPGSLFVVACRYLGVFKFDETSILIEFFVYYFAGMTISRIGSIIVEPLFKKLGIVIYAPYGDYLSAVKQDERIETLLEQNNTYRTLVALFFSIFLLIALDFVALKAGLSRVQFGAVLTALISILYILAFRKQTSYIKQRVEHNNQEN